MARIICSNNFDTYKRQVNRIAQNGLTNYENIELNRVYVAIFQKRMIKNENCLRFPNGDFIGSAGTLIYDSLLGKPALKKLYHDFNGNVADARKWCMGNYLILLKKNGNLYGFVDKYQTLHVYYYCINGYWFISNSLADVGFSLTDPKVDEFSLIQESLLCQRVGKQSIFKDVYQLYGNEFIKIDMKTNQFSLIPLSYHRQRQNLEDAPIEAIVNQYAELVIKNFGVIAGAFGNSIGLHMTGGLDTRTVFSAFSAVGCTPNVLMYGVGNTELTNTKKEDMRIVLEYARRFGVDIHIMNWRHQKEDFDIDNWDKYFNKYGFYYSLYGSSSNFFAEYEGKIPSYPLFMECGYFGENLRLREWLKERTQKNFSIEEFVEEYCFKPFLKRIYPNYDRLLSYLTALFEQYSKLYGILTSSQEVDHDNFDEFRWLAARYADSRMVNLLNEFTYSIATFGLPELHEFPFDIPARFREDGRFQLMLIDKLNQTALDIPIFSHCHYQELDRMNYTVTPMLRIENRISRFLKGHGINGHFYELLKKIYFMAQRGKGQHDRATSIGLREFLIEQISQDDDGMSFIEPDKFYGDLRHLCNYAQYLHGIKTISGFTEERVD